MVEIKKFPNIKTNSSYHVTLYIQFYETQNETFLKYKQTGTYNTKNKSMTRISSGN